MDVITVPLEYLVRTQFDNHIQIPRRTSIRSRFPFPRYTETGSIIHSRRNVDLQFLFHTDFTRAVTTSARIRDNLSRSITRRTRRHGLEKSAHG